MKIMIYLLLASLLFAGCVVSEQESVSDSTEPASEPGTTPESTENQESQDEMPDVTETEDDVWGTECEKSWDCGSFDDLKDCVRGHCVDIECNFRSDCPEGTEFCFDGECLMKSDLEEKFETCCADQSNDECLCHGVCENCDDGEYTCTFTSSGSGDEQTTTAICTECMFDSSCKEGFACVKHRCVPGPSE